VTIPPLFGTQGRLLLERKVVLNSKNGENTRPDFIEVVSKSWSLQVDRNNPLDIWQAKVRCFRMLKGGVLI
jgi:hypothetical protein